jgi:hypothetical protein
MSQDNHKSNIQYKMVPVYLSQFRKTSYTVTVLVLKNSLAEWFYFWVNLFILNFYLNILLNKDPCFFCNKSGERNQPRPHGSFGFHGGFVPPPIKVVHCMHCNSVGYKEFAGRMDPCFHCNNNRERPPNYSAVYCIHCQSTGYK